MKPRRVNLADMFGRFEDHWSPKIVGEVNDSLVKLVKLKGEFEPNSTLNTGNVRNDRTVPTLDRL